ncbi:MAG: BatA domain-containing protein [Candidatus Marinimicrobia bacterium]|nr:BatA domain-containing protein [Candidatus Neomarinimicrobiota bacterium]
MNFLQPLLLIFTSLATIPIIIHLISERRYKKYYFSSIKFLKEIRSGSMKKMKLKQWLILLFRVLWILALIFAFSQPFWKRIKSGNSSLENGVIIVDNSFSMNLDEQLESKIKHLEKQFSEWQFVKISDGKFSVDSVKYTIDNYFNANGILNQNVILFTDLQKNKMTGSLLTVIKNAEKVERSNFIIQNEMPNFNVNISEIFIENSFHPLDEFVEINIKANSSIERFDISPVYLNVNGKRIGQVTLDGNGYGSFSFIPENDDWILGTVTIEGDDYEKDNSVYFSFPVQRKINILNILKPDDENYLKLAFDAIEEINSKTILPSELSSNDIQEIDLIIINNLYRFSSAQFRRLLNYSQKKPILIVAGKETKNNYWNKFTGNLTKRSGDNSNSFLTLKKIHSKYKFNQFSQSQLKIKKHYRTDKTSKTDIWELSNSDPLLFKNRKLKIYTMLSPFDFSWNEFGLSPYFTRLIKSFIHQAIYFPNTNLQLNESITNSGQEFTIINTQNEKERVQSVFSKTNSAGFYEMRFNDKTIIYSVNIPESEKVIEKNDAKKYEKVEWNSDVYENIKKLKHGKSLNELFLILAVLFFGMEMFLLAIGGKEG